MARIGYRQAGVEQIPELPELKSLADGSRRVGASFGQALKETCCAGVFAIKSMRGTLTEDENRYYSSIEPHLFRLGKRFLHTEWKTSFIDSMKHVPPDGDGEIRRIYLNRVVQPLIFSGAIDEKQDFAKHAMGFQRLYDSLKTGEDGSEGKRGMPVNPGLMDYAMKNLTESGLIKTPQDWDKLALSVGRIKNPNARAAFIGSVISPMKKSEAVDSVDAADAAAQEFEKCAEKWGWENDDKAVWLQDIMICGKVKTPGDWGDIRESLDGIPKSRLRDSGAQRGYASVIGEALNSLKTPADIRRDMDEIKRYIQKHGENDMIWKVGADNLLRGNPRIVYDDAGKPDHISSIPGVDAYPRPLRFDGGLADTLEEKTTPLSGAATGVLLRDISNEAYRAWAKARDAKVPCEQMLTREMFLTTVTSQQLYELDPESLGKKLDEKHSGDIAKMAAGAHSVEVVGRRNEKRVVALDSKGKTLLNLRARMDSGGDYMLSVKCFRASMRRDGVMRVACRYAGQDLPSFLADESNMVHMPDVEKMTGKIAFVPEPKISDDSGQIPKRLSELGIIFNKGEGVKPENYAVEVIDGKPTVRIVDFGKARIAGE